MCLTCCGLSIYTVTLFSVHHFPLPPMCVTVSLIIAIIYCIVVGCLRVLCYRRRCCPGAIVKCFQPQQALEICSIIIITSSMYSRSTHACLTVCMDYRLFNVRIIRYFCMRVHTEASVYRFIRTAFCGVCIEVDTGEMSDRVHDVARKSQQAAWSPLSIVLSLSLEERSRFGKEGQNKGGGACSPHEVGQRSSFIKPANEIALSLCLCQSVCLSLSVSACLSVCLPVCLSVYLSVCLSACLPACLSVSVSVCLSLSLALWPCFCLSVSLPPPPPPTLSLFTILGCKCFY